ncbi:hypothetical protein F2P81_014595 [Scophthalmus maximus]|uniref:Uncharacterized protein n=1 Tax=Scophthalmus maximus TaxID=52904 RepID=A0A6A4SI85_SCOMX|nr:hypothetical protein F2P81_014595 [Scophthalmus maximus]
MPILNHNTFLSVLLNQIFKEKHVKSLQSDNVCREALHRAAAMDEMDLPQMKKEVESLKYQLAFKREKSSKTVTECVVRK